MAAPGSAMPAVPATAALAWVPAVGVRRRVSRPARPIVCGGAGVVECHSSRRLPRRLPRGPLVSCLRCCPCVAAAGRGPPRRLQRAPGRWPGQAARCRCLAVQAAQKWQAGGGALRSRASGRVVRAQAPWQRGQTIERAEWARAAVPVATAVLAATAAAVAAAVAAAEEVVAVVVVVEV